ncbi:hypothetical protein EJ06DRAFT_482407 [Trichodelitschia bisporula]|uniref:Rap-GAP domain-containing protein n=1 Tax=Trichodelitschia bisporula TaxID=703511 RepID=A0A6G1HM77_9PEZI|nr:hypothetical protein EJ06DRAFT_482407 [Trichodelitschia bisporula]
MPPPGDDPRTPERRPSQSTLLSAFRTLTSGRPKSSSQAPPSNTLAQPSFVHGESTADLPIRSELQDKESTSASSPVSGIDSEPDAPLRLDDIVGGPPELPGVLELLRKAHTSTERINAADQASSILRKYPVKNLLTLWTAGRDLLRHDSAEASRSGYNLLISCTGQSGLSPRERKLFFDAISSSDHHGHTDLRFRALVELTNNGRDIDPFEPHIAPLLTQFLEVSFNSASQMRKQGRKGNPETVARETVLEGIFDFIIEVTKFNAQVIQEDGFIRLLDQIILICKKTTSEADIVCATKVINSLITFTEVPHSTLRPCLELLCDVHRQLSSLKTHSWEVLGNIFRSHLGQSAVQELVHILETASTPPGQPPNVVRGALSALSHLVLAHGSEELPIVPISSIMPAIDHALDIGERKLELDVLLLLQGLLGDEELARALAAEVDWSCFTSSIVKCTDGLALGRPASGNAIQDAADTSSLESVSDSDVVRGSEAFGAIISELCRMFPTSDLLRKDLMVGLFLELGSKLDDQAAETLIRHCANDRLIYPSNDEWEAICKRLSVEFLQDQSRPSDLRVLTASFLRDAYASIECLPGDKPLDFARMFLEKMSVENDPLVLEILASFGVAVVERADQDTLDFVLAAFRATIFQRRSSTTSQSGSPSASLATGLSVSTPASLCRVAAKHVVRMFIGNINRSTGKAEALFDLVLQIARSHEIATDARICAVKLLCRLRANSDCAIYIRPLSESESMAAVLCRTVETANWIQAAEEAVSRDAKGAASGVLQSSSLKQKAFNVRRPVPPLWFYPGPKGLPEEPPPDASTCLYSFLETPVKDAPDAPKVLKITHWLETVIGLLQYPETDWEIYSYVVVHLGAQLGNQNLFRAASPQIQLLRAVLCEQIRASSFHDPPSYTSLKKADVAICLFHVLTMLISYRTQFSKGEQDEIVRALTLGIGSWDRTSKWCIHALSVCCHELRSSTSKCLDIIVQKMSQIITQPQIAIHILEFLTGLARMPELYKNFSQEEYKMVFGVSFRYLQYSRDQKEKEASQPLARPSRAAVMRHSDSFRELRQQSDQDSRPNIGSPSDDLPQYVHALAYHVITFWFMALKLQDRPIYKPWIAEKLAFTDKFGNYDFEEQALVTLDMMDKIAFSDRDETVYKPDFAKPADGEVSRRTWIVGLSFLTIETAGRTGLSQITHRRPSGTKYHILQPSLTSPPRHQVPLTVGLEYGAFRSSAYTGVLPDDILQESYAPLTIAAPPGWINERPIPLPDDDMTRRALSSFDLNPTVDGHKVGVIYIAPGQTSEAEILANTYGSADYTSFVSALGTLMRLKDARFNTQGLDRHGDSDGKYTYAWRDRATEIVFHATTMMPTDLEYDPQCTKKKSHIGNDFVNVVWNESGLPFKFDTFPSAFNYVYIIITPETAPSFVSLRTTDRLSYVYKVQVVSRPGFPEISSAAEAKLLTFRALPSFIRFLALNASVFSLVWANREHDDHFSPWRNRLREIKRMRDTHGEPHNRKSQSGPGGPSSGLNSAGASATGLPGGGLQGLMTPASGSRERIAQRASMATFGSSGENRSSLTPSTGTGTEGD